MLSAREGRVPIGCVYVPNFSLRVAVLDRPQLDGTPLVLVASDGMVVADCTPEARKEGIRPGMRLREVTALSPDAVLIPPHPVRDEAVFAQIVDRLEEISPLVEPAEPGRCYVDLRGLERHFNGQEAAAVRLLQAVPAILRPRVGIAPEKFTAWTAASQAASNTMRVIEPADVTDFLATLPIITLPLPLTMVRQMRRLGLRTMGDLAVLPGTAIAARFGPAGRHAWELANGRDDNPVVPRKRKEIIVETLALPAPTTNREMVLFSLKRLVVRAFGRPTLRNRCVRQVLLRAVLEGDRSWEQTLVLREPYGRDRLIKALNHRLQSLELPGPVAELILELSGLVIESGRQEALAGFHRRWSQGMVDATRHLKQRYGTSPIYRVIEVEPWSRIPERRHALISYDP